jgi:MGT family glycosyltransferase
MASILIVTWHGGGNIHAVLATAADLVDLGHTVTVLSNPVLRERFQAIGATFHAYRRIASHDSSSPETDLIRLHEGRTIAEANQIIGERLVFGPARALCEDTLEMLDAVRPAVVVVDYVLPGAMTAAEARGTAYIVVSDLLYPLPFAGRAREASPFAYLFERMTRSALPGFNVLRESLGLRAIPEASRLYETASIFLVMAYPEFSLEALPERTLYVGPQFAPPTSLSGDSSLECDDQPLVLGSFSTVHLSGQTEFIGMLVECLTELPVHARIGSGSACVPRSSSTNVETCPWISLAENLPAASLLVNHAGGGTIMRALAYGVPQLCVPFVADQFEYARRVVDIGVGLSITRSSGRAECRQALETLLCDPVIRRRSREIALSIREQHQPRQAARVIERLCNLARDADS